MGEIECSALYATGATESLMRLGTQCDTSNHKARACMDCGLITIFCDTWLGDDGNCAHENVIEDVSVKYAGVLASHIFASMRVCVALYDN